MKYSTKPYFWNEMANFQYCAKEWPNWLNVNVINLGLWELLHQVTLYTYGFLVCHREPLVLFQYP